MLSTVRNVSVEIRQSMYTLMDMLNVTMITMVWELYQEGVPKTHIAQRLGKHRETIHLWIGGIEREGLLPFLDRYQQAKKGPRPKRQVDPTVKRWVWAIREREAGCCGQKIAYFLEREHGTRLSVPKIYEILREKYVIRSKWKKNRRRGPVPVAGGPRQVVQMDTVMFGSLFAFTAIDIHTREADILVAPALTAAYGCTFLEQAMTRRFDGWVELIQTDGGSEFKESFARNVLTYCQRHRVARPYKKNEQAYIESFNRTVRKECLGWLHYRLEDLPESTLPEERGCIPSTLPLPSATPQPRITTTTQEGRTGTVGFLRIILRCRPPKRLLDTVPPCPYDAAHSCTPASGVPERNRINGYPAQERHHLESFHKARWLSSPG